MDSAPSSVCALSKQGKAGGGGALTPTSDRTSVQGVGAPDFLWEGQGGGRKWLQPVPCAPGSSHKVWVPGTKHSLSFVSLQLLSLCPLSGRGPGPAPSRPGKWKPEGKGEGCKAIPPSTPPHLQRAPWPLGGSQVWLTTGPAQPGAALPPPTRPAPAPVPAPEEGMWGVAAVPSLFVFFLPCTPPHAFF